jgi:hypothetical protein
MTFQAVPRRRYRVRIYTSELILDGQLEPIGRLMDDLDDPSKTSSLLYQAQIRPLVADSSLRPFGLQEVTTSKSDFHLVYVADADDRDGLVLMKRTELMIAYTSRFVIRGRFHMGIETHLRYFVDDLSSSFLPVDEATIYPLFQPSVDIPRRYPLLLVNKQQIRLYHPPESAQAEE